MAKDALYWNLYKKFGRVIDNTFNEYCDQVAHDMDDLYQNIVDWFYADYDPIWYHRTESLRYASSTYEDHFEANRSTIFKSYIEGAHTHVKNITMNVDPKYIPGNPYRADEKEWVFYRFFGAGRTKNSYQSKFTGRTRDGDNKGKRNFKGTIHGFTAADNKYWGRKGHINRYGEKSKWVKVKHIPRSKSGGIKLTINGVSFRRGGAESFGGVTENIRTNLNVVLANRIKDLRQAIYSNKNDAFNKLLTAKLIERGLYNG